MNSSHLGMIKSGDYMNIEKILECMIGLCDEVEIDNLNASDILLIIFDYIGDIELEELKEWYRYACVYPDKSDDFHLIIIENGEVIEKAGNLIEIIELYGKDSPSDYIMEIDGDRKLVHIDAIRQMEGFLEYRQRNSKVLYRKRDIDDDIEEIVKKLSGKYQNLDIINIIW